MGFKAQKYTAGRFKVEIWDPYPAWVRIYCRDAIDQGDFPIDPITNGLKVSEVKDLYYLLGRLLEDAKGHDLG